MEKRVTKVGVNCLIKKPLEIRISDQNDNLSSGVAVIDVTVQGVPYLDLKSISFKNNYTAFITVKVKCSPKSQKEEAKWKNCVRQYQLMPDPHTETASQDYFTITRLQMLFEPDKVTALRLVLQQPSPVWAHFSVEDVVVHSMEVKTESPTSVTTWLLENQHLTSTSRRPLSRQHTEVTPPMDKITAGLQHLWALTETMRANQTQTSLGRYDVDGSYEINLLSYS